MFRLRNLKNGLWQIHSKMGQAYEGTPKMLFATVLKMGIQESELTYAVNELEKTGDDYADFGNQGRFMYTKKNGR